MSFIEINNDNLPGARKLANWCLNKALLGAYFEHMKEARATDEELSLIHI